MNNISLQDLEAHGTSEVFKPRMDGDTPISPATGFKIDAVNAADVGAPTPGDYLIKGVIEPSQVSIWFGPPGTGKTFLLLHLAYALSRGETAFGRRIHQADTLYLALEGRGGIDKRVYAFFKTIGPAPHFWWAAQGIELLQTDRSGGARINTEHVEGLTAFIRDHNIKLVIIDTLNLTLGGADENDNSAMGLLIKAAGDIVMTTSAHVAFIAHSAKAGTDGGPRGGGAQKGNADLVVSVTGEKIFVASCFAPGGKIKDGAPFKLHFRLKIEKLLVDDDGDDITSCTVEEIVEPENAKGLKPTKGQQGWLDDLVGLFAESGANSPMKREVLPGLTLPTLTRDQVRDGYRIKGRLGDANPDKTIEGKYRTRMSDALIALKDCGKIGLTDKYVWLIT